MASLRELRGELLRYSRGRQAGIEACELMRGLATGTPLPLSWIAVGACMREVHVALERALATAANQTISEVWRPEIGRLALLELDLDDWHRRMGPIEVERFALAQHATRGYAARLLADAATQPIGLLGPLFAFFVGGIPTRVLHRFWRHTGERSHAYFDACASVDLTLARRLDSVELSEHGLATVHAATDAAYRATLEMLDNVHMATAYSSQSPSHVERESS